MLPYYVLFLEKKNYKLYWDFLFLLKKPIFYWKQIKHLAE